MNPFLNSTFTSIWSNRFSKNTQVRIPFFEKISFYKIKYLPLFINIGKNLTKGLAYNHLSKYNNGLRNKVFLIYDVPDHGTKSCNKKIGRLHCKVSKQYPGFLIDLSAFENFQDYMVKNFSKSSRYKLKKYRSRLRESFTISTEMYLGEMGREEYVRLFKKFRALLSKRFSGKKIVNNNLNKKEWDFYEEVVYPMILNKEASLFVIYQEQDPIAITLIFYADNVMINSITVFDTDYFKFHLGSVMIMELLEWGFEHNMKALDFSKGDFEYKRQWMSKEYNFYYHVWYDSKSLTSFILGKSLISYLNLKSYLRTRKLLELVHRVSFQLRFGKGRTNTVSQKFIASPIEQEMPVPEKETIDVFKNGYGGLRQSVFEILYLNKIHINDIQVFAIKNQSGFVAKAKNKAWKITPF